MNVPSSLIECLLALAQQHPQRRALLDCGPFIEGNTDHHRSILPCPQWKNWSELAVEVNALTSCLHKRHLEPGSIVVSVLPNSTAWITVDLACQALGLIHAPIDYRYPHPLILSLIDWIQPAFAILPAVTSHNANVESEWPSASPSLSPLVRWDAIEREFADCNLVDKDAACAELSKSYLRVQARRSDEETATILFTSGTTDTPKGVLLSHRNLVTNAAGKLHAMPQSSADTRLNFLPFSHSYARTCELSTWLLTGGQLILARHMKHVVTLAQAYRPTLINGVPLFFDQLRVTHGPLSKHQALVEFLGGSIRQLASGGAALNLDTAEYFEAAQLPVLVGYGLTEASPVVCSNLSSDGRTDNVGPPIPGVSIRVDASGELWVSGSGVMKGYLRNTVATADAIIDGELRTGDLAEVDSRGRVKLVGRVRDTLILSSGVKVAPYQVEKQLKFNAGIEDAVVLGDGWERCAAVVVLSRDLWSQFSRFTRAEQFEFLGKCQKGLSPLPKYAVPAAWVFRANSFATNPNLVNFKGTPRRDMIRLQYADVLRESIRSGAISIHLDPMA